MTDIMCITDLCDNILPRDVMLLIEDEVKFYDIMYHTHHDFKCKLISNSMSSLLTSIFNFDCIGIKTWICNPTNRYYKEYLQGSNPCTSQFPTFDECYRQMIVNDINNYHLYVRLDNIVIQKLTETLLIMLKHTPQLNLIENVCNMCGMN